MSTSFVRSDASKGPLDFTFQDVWLQVSDHTIVIIWVMKIFFVQFFCVFLPPLHLLLLLGPYHFCPLLSPSLHEIQSAKTRPGADCGSDHELLIAQVRLKLEKVEKTTSPFRYDLNHIPYDYTVEVRNRFKGLDLIDGVSDELWTEIHATV